MGLQYFTSMNAYFMHKYECTIPHLGTVSVNLYLRNMEATILCGTISEHRVCVIAYSILFVLESLQQASILQSANISKVLDEMTDLPKCGCARCPGTRGNESSLLALCDRPNAGELREMPAPVPEIDELQNDMQACLLKFRSVNQADPRLHIFPAAIYVLILKCDMTEDV